MFPRLLFIKSNNLTKPAKIFFSTNSSQPNLPVLINKNAQSNNESDPELGLLIKKYLSKDLGNPTNTVNIKIINYIDKLEKLPDGQSLNLHLSGEEMDKLITYVKNNLNKELSDIVFYSWKQFHSWLNIKE